MVNKMPINQFPLLPEDIAKNIQLDFSYSVLISILNSILQQAKGINILLFFWKMAMAYKKEVASEYAPEALGPYSQAVRCKGKFKNKNWDSKFVMDCTFCFRKNRSAKILDTVVYWILIFNLYSFWVLFPLNPLLIFLYLQYIFKWLCHI